MDSLESPSDRSKPPSSLSDLSPFTSPSSRPVNELNCMPSPSSLMTASPITPFKGCKTQKSNPLSSPSVPHNDGIPEKEEPTTPEHRPIFSTPLNTKQLSAAPKKSSPKKLLKNQDIAIFSPQLSDCKQKTDRKSQRESPAVMPSIQMSNLWKTTLGQLY